MHDKENIQNQKTKSDDGGNTQIGNSRRVSP